MPLCYGSVVLEAALRSNSIHTTVRGRYGFIVGRFIDEFYLFEIAIMVRKLAVVLSTVAVRGANKKAAYVFLAEAYCDLR